MAPHFYAHIIEQGPLWVVLLALCPYFRATWDLVRGCFMKHDWLQSTLFHLRLMHKVRIQDDLS